MGAIIRVVIALVFGGVLLYLAVDDLTVYFNHSELQSFTIEDIETNGVGDARYIEVADGSPIGAFVYETKNGVPVKLYYPLLSNTSIESYLEDDSQPLIAKVVVSTERFESACVEQETCAEPGLRTVSGVVQVGLNSIDQETRDLFADSDFALDENVIYMDMDARPSIFWGLLKLAGGLAFLLYAIVPFFLGRMSRDKDIPLPTAQQPQA
ncbi:MAG TPA: hypothetical protein VGD69_24445 [Herpetosiphonaceae bacterium]